MHLGRRGLWVAMAGLVVAGCLGRAGGAASGSPEAVPPEPVHGGRLVRVLSTGPDSLDPAKAVASETDRILANLYDGLLGADEQGRLVPRLAERYEVSADGLTYTFFLRRGVRFHNGREMTSDDVRFTFERLLDPATRYKRAADWQAVQAVQTPDPYTVVVRLSRPYAPFLAALADPSASIVPREAVETLATRPVGTGPFRFVEWVQESHVRLRRFDGYWDAPRPYLDEVIFRFIPDPAAALAAFLAGDADVVDISPDRVALLQAPGARPSRVVSGPANVVQILALNQARSPWDQLPVRRAVAHAIDRRELISVISEGRAKPLYSGLTPENAYFVPLDDPYPHDPAEARRLLSEAGYPDGVRATLVVPSVYEFHVQTAQLIQQQLARVGIRLEIQLVDWARWLAEVYAGEQYDATIIGFTGKLDPHPELSRYHSSYARNFVNFADPDYDRVIDEAVRTADPQQRRELYAEAQRILADRLAAIFLVDPTLTLTVAADVHGWAIYPHYIDDLRTVYRASGR